MNDDLDTLDFANMDPPTFVTQIGAALVLTPAASFTGAVEAWAIGDNIERRDIFLKLGKAE